MILEKAIQLVHYASGSAMAYIAGRLYLAGDNMAYLLVLDTGFNKVDSITVIDAVESPIPKPKKPDIEAATTVWHEGAEAILLIGSGSLDPYRSKAWLVNPTSKQNTVHDLQPFYSRIKKLGLTDLNIEGATTMKDIFILAARGNNSTPVNHLIFTSMGFWNEPATATISFRTVSTGNSNGGVFSGVSGMTYSAMSDCLILTVSTENTASAYEDGAIGISYLWLINKASYKNIGDAIVADRIIDLEAEDSRFHAQKIEAVTIVSESQCEIKLALAADNDDGTTVLFMVTLEK